MPMTFDEFLKEVCERHELDWRKYRRHAARRHLDGRLRELGLAGYEPYVELLRRDPAEAELLPDLLRVTVSRFFREREHWDFLAREVLPGLLSHSRDSGRPLRAWCAGCCNGEEPYSLALLLLSMPAASGPGAAPVEIVATDIDEAVLERARAGRYCASSVREVPQALLERYFSRVGDEFRLDKKVRGMVELRRHNIREDEPPEGIDLALCRYLVFTYFTGERRRLAAERLWRALSAGGVLMTGRKDRLGPRMLEFFSPWPGSGVFFVRRER